jgi:hypothetical protein
LIKASSYSKVNREAGYFIIFMGMGATLKDVLNISMLMQIR